MVGRIGHKNMTAFGKVNKSKIGKYLVKKMLYF